MDVALSVDPTQRMSQHVELSGIVADDDELLVQGVMVEAADEGAFGGDAPVARVGDVQGVEMSAPGELIGEVTVRVVA